MAQVLDELRLLIGVQSAVVELSESLLASVVIVREKLVLIVVLEGNQSFLDACKAQHIHSVQVLPVYPGRQRLQDQVDIDLVIVGGGTVSNENELLKEFINQLKLLLGYVLRHKRILIVKLLSLNKVVSEPDLLLFLSISTLLELPLLQLVLVFLLHLCKVEHVLALVELLLQPAEKFVYEELPEYLV